MQAAKERLFKLAGRIDALPSRDRMALAGGLLAAFIGIELAVLLPKGDRRAAMAASVQQQSESEIEAQNAAREDAALRFETATRRAEELDVRLAALGVHRVQRDALDGFVRRALQQRGTTLTGLRALPVEALEVAAAAAAPEAAPADPGDGSSAAAVAPVAAPRLYRHRAELTLEGPAAQVAESIGVLEAGLKPLRVEQVVLTAPPGGGPVKALLILTTISPEATWLAL